MRIINKVQQSIDEIIWIVRMMWGCKEWMTRRLVSAKLLLNAWLQHSTKQGVTIQQYTCIVKLRYKNKFIFIWKKNLIFSSPDMKVDELFWSPVVGFWSVYLSVLFTPVSFVSGLGRICPEVLEKKILKFVNAFYYSVIISPLRRGFDLHIKNWIWCFVPSLVENVPVGMEKKTLKSFQ